MGKWSNDVEHTKGTNASCIYRTLEIRFVRHEIAGNLLLATISANFISAY